METKTVLITGASSGIGHATALRYAARGARLVLVARGADGLRSTEAECLRAGAPDVMVYPADVADGDGVRRAFDAAGARFGHIDIVVQNAALAAFGRFTDMPADVFDTVIRTDVSGAANVARAALDHFRARGHGQLVIVGSLLGHAAVPYMSPYVMSKFAVTALIRILRQETRGLRGVSVHGIYPGAVDTPIYPLSANYFGRLARVLPVKDSPEKMARAIVKATDSGRSSERQVGLANRPMLLGYRLLPRVFDAMVGPLMRLGSFTRTPLAPTAGNAVTSETAGAQASR
jgi:NAD(P)-dependent dehydrogenase (short-subunit alcohol dehydrogenase family)